MLLQTIGLGLSIGQEIGATNRARREGRKQGGFFNNALADLGLAEKTLQESLGSSLALPTLESERTLESVSESGQKALGEINKRQEQTIEKTGFANVGLDENLMKDIRKEFQKKREDIDINLTKNLGNVLSQFEKQKFEMKSQRQQLEMQKRMANQQANTKYFGIF
tara:strand:+ start:1740 stop:2237 length:498 start_codon:yes stop_codon:yes gene_type:complete